MKLDIFKYTVSDNMLKLIMVLNGALAGWSPALTSSIRLRRDRRYWCRGICPHRAI